MLKISFTSNISRDRIFAVLFFYHFCELYVNAINTNPYLYPTPIRPKGPPPRQYDQKSPTRPQMRKWMNERMSVYFLHQFIHSSVMGGGKGREKIRKKNVPKKFKFSLDFLSSFFCNLKKLIYFHKSNFFATVFFFVFFGTHIMR